MLRIVVMLLWSGLEMNLSISVCDASIAAPDMDMTRFELRLIFIVECCKGWTGEDDVVCTWQWQLVYALCFPIRNRSVYHSLLPGFTCCKVVNIFIQITLGPGQKFSRDSRVASTIGLMRTKEWQVSDVKGISRHPKVKAKHRYATLLGAVLPPPSVSVEELKAGGEEQI